MALAGITSWEQLAEATPFSRSLLKDLGTERADATESHLRSIAAACRVPYAWFTVPTLTDAVAGAEDSTLSERVEALERRLDVERGRRDEQADAVKDRLDELGAELRREQLDRANLETALQEVLGEGLRQALGGARRR
jgi:hypothetical protein